MDLDTAVTQLYGAAPEDFVAARTALAAQVKAGGDAGLAKAVASIRKPTVAAWAVNQLVRQDADEVDALLDLAGRLQSAAEAMDGGALRDLGRERTRLVDRLLRATRDAAEAAGGSLTGATAEQVRETYVAALAQPSAAQAVASGQLTRALSYAGFGDVDLSEALAAPRPNRRPALTVLRGEKRDDAPEPEPRPDEDEDEEEGEAPGPDPALLEQLEQARARTRETTSQAAAAGQALEQAEAALTSLDERIAALEADLKAARAERDTLLDTRAEARAADKAAQRALRGSFAELDRVQDLLGDDADD
ncbi:hypothetical protein [Lapillicoccus jejuensis]|uniref:Uncharacterized protein n=1 Tax=Lapillicoccus jejuensis TaxID=402171 RepID=A0A542E3V2_9MICO|nr:hypothetical protein [Lapillicoccus jejuensis]TQJ10023.1 hypothetical protein FB458_3141 [Lapillicoccus jejuensis]